MKKSKSFSALQRAYDNREPDYPVRAEDMVDYFLDDARAMAINPYDNAEVEELALAMAEKYLKEGADE